MKKLQPALLALALGFGGGMLVHASGATGSGFERVLDPIGALWMNALRMTVIPLVLANLVLGISGGRRPAAVGRLGSLALALFVGLLAIAGAATVAVVPSILRALPAQATHFGAGLGPAPAVPSGPAPSFESWLVGLVPANPFRAAADADILALLVFTLLFALALNRIAPELRRPMLAAAHAVAEIMAVILRWVLAVMPIGVFALCFPLAARTGPAGAGAVGTYVVLESALLVACTLLLYPAVAVAGGVSIGRFARAVWPAQAVAVSTRSSLAALPSLVDGATRTLGLPAPVTGFVLPLSVASFQLNRTVSGGVKLLFLAHAFGIAISPAQLVTFLASMLLLSFSTPGIPSVGTVRSLPLYLALGIPIEGVLILNAVDAIPDLFKTILNVTGDLGVAAFVARWAGTASVPSPISEPVPAAAEASL